MWFSSWLANRNPSQAGTHGRTPSGPRKRPTFRPRLEALEDRFVPSTLTVTNNLDTGVAGDGSLRGEIAAAAPSGDTIVFAPSLAGQTIYLTNASGELVINKSLTIQGPAAPLTPITISPSYPGYSRLFEIDGPSTQVALSNLNLTGGDGRANVAANPPAALDGGGGAIYNAGILTLNTCNLDNNNPYGGVFLGGAIYNAGTLTVNNSTLSSNSAGWVPNGTSEVSGDGGAIYNTGTLTVNNSILSGNQVLANFDSGRGAAIFNALHASATVTGSSLSDNVSQDGNGVIYNDGTMTFSGSTLSSNLPVEDGGGIFNDRKGRLTIQSKSSITNNFPYDLNNFGWVKISKDSSVG